MPETPGSGTSAPREVAEAMYDAMLRSDRDTLTAITSPEIRIRVTDALPYGGTYSGLAGFAAFFKKTFDLIESRIEFERLFDAGGQVVAVGRTKGTGRESGQPFDSAIVHVFTVEDGTIVGFDAYVEDGPITTAIEGTGAPD
ncbi:nuclear transport factor 2 family protein [Streptomyces sp. NPDC026673]|uniref:nuclear transport factor 2 family protein n=1 Tax=Streptomyces sp. NPDC026673 TaxID=3155724 RepID=UPI0033C1E9E1